MFRLLIAGLAGALSVVIGALLIAVAVAYTGTYNIAATEQHTSAVRWLFDTTFENSIKANASSIRSPSITPEMEAAGAAAYKAMCQHCHAAPGVEREKWASGMRPRPPHLTEAATHWQTREIFWLVKHGAKMTGMPAFGPTHDDQVLWNLASFVSRLPAMTPERYAELSGGQAHHGQTKQ